MSKIPQSLVFISFISTYCSLLAKRFSRVFARLCPSESLNSLSTMTSQLSKSRSLNLLGLPYFYYCT